MSKRVVKRFKAWGCYPLIVEVCWVHWEPNCTHHGPQSNPRLIALSWLDLKYPPSIMRRLWVYFRGGYALYVDITIDRREPQPN